MIYIIIGVVIVVIVALIVAYSKGWIRTKTNKDRWTNYATFKNLTNQEFEKGNLRTPQPIPFKFENDKLLLQIGANEYAEFSFDEKLDKIVGKIYENTYSSSEIKDNSFTLLVDGIPQTTFYMILTFS